jgi:hypothetical protein
MNEQKKTNEMMGKNNGSSDRRKKPYESPTLTEYGELAEVTQTGSTPVEVDASKAYST